MLGVCDIFSKILAKVIQKKTFLFVKSYSSAAELVRVQICLVFCWNCWENLPFCRNFKMIKYK